MAAELPAGTVTLLFTDIEGSSRLWDHHRAAMAAALRKHNELLTGAIDGRGGHIVKDKGDGFFAAFASPEDAVATAVAAQRVIAQAKWPEDIGAVAVRMAIHTGSIEPDGDDYRGPVVNRVARLEGLAHGGQVLVSETTRALLADTLPAGMSLRNVGSHVLRGMARPETVYQLTADGLRSDFPPLRVSIGAGVELPIYPTSFVGRQEELAAIDALLESGEARLITLLGPGGIGKTRLAVETARRVGIGFGGRTYFADLAPLSNPNDVEIAIAEAVGAHPEGTGSPISLVASRITEPTLLVLDNFEHVTAAATSVAGLLDVCPMVRLIATSRTPLNIRGERRLHVEPLSSSDGEQTDPPALSLFYERASSYGVAIAGSGPERESALAITRRLDGLPLAIELVAARTRILGLSELAEMLNESLDALGTGTADAPDRQRTIRATIEWSLRGLTSEQRTLFAHVAAFPAGATLDQLAAVEHEVPKAELLERITALVDNSLVTVTTGLPGGTRYRQLVLLRDYGRELLEATGAYDETMGRLVDYYVMAADGLAKRLRHSDAPNEELAVDHQNLLAAMNWSLGGDRIADMVDVVCRLWTYWFNGDLARNAIEWVSQVEPLHSSPQVDWLIGFLAVQTGDATTALARMEIARGAFESAGDDEWLARTAMFQSFFAEDPEAGRGLAEQAVAFFAQLEPGVDLFVARLMESSYHFRAGDLEEAIRIRRELLEWGEEVEFATMIAWSHWNLALALLANGQVAEARDHNLATMRLMAASGYQEGIASSADVEASIRLRHGHIESGLRLVGGAEAIWEKIGTVRWPEAAANIDEALAAADQSLGETEVARLKAEGGGLNLEQLVEQTLNVPS